MREEKIYEELDEKIVVYTVIMGDYDYLKDPEYIMENCDYICFTNNRNLTSDVWKIRYDSCENLDNTKWQRRHKIMAHEYLPEYKWSVYVDGNVRITGDFRKYIRSEGQGKGILCLKHPNRNNVYEEAEACIQLKKDNPDIIMAQMRKYKEEGYTGNNGLVVSNVLVRCHMDSEVINIMEQWWREIETFSRRDQLSFNYVCWKNNYNYDVSLLKCWKSEYWMNPGIHTSQIKDVEKELIDHLQLEDYYESQLKDKITYISWKEQELADANTQLKWKEQELADANTQLKWKEQELADANTQLKWKEQELADANTQLRWKEQELADANTRTEWKEQELQMIKKSKLWRLKEKFKRR